MKNGLDEQYIDLLKDILENGIEKNTRNGKVISVFGRTIRYKFKDGKFPLLTTKKMAWNVMVAELLWFLRGDTNIKFLLDYNCHIWNGDAYKNFEKQWLKENPPFSGPYTNLALTQNEFVQKIKTDGEFAKEWGELGPIYGRQWRSWEGLNSNTDQIQNLINDLKTNPDSRRLMVNAWNVGELDQMVLPPCHYGFQVYTRELSNKERYRIWFNKNYETGMEFNDELIPDFDDKYYESTPKRAISLMWNQRSVDTFLGLPFNIASYGLLLMMIADEVGMYPDELIGNLGDVHLYLNHIEQAKEQIKREPFNLPTIEITERNWYQHQLVKERLGEKSFSDKILSYRPDCFELIGYESHPKIKAPLSN